MAAQGSSTSSCSTNQDDMVMDDVYTVTDDDTDPVCIHQTRYRCNTVEEKQHMRNARKRQLCQAKTKPVIRKIKTQLEVAHKKVEDCQTRISTLKCMTRTFWERWRWELEKRKEAMIMNTHIGIHLQAHQKDTSIHEIDVAMLESPIINGNVEECFIGTGSFGAVKLQVYRGVHVAVKEFFGRTLKEDVKKEAEVLASLCHPYLPYLFGICTTSKPLRIVMQFHGIVNGTDCKELNPQSITLAHELQHPQLQLLPDDWLIICAQLLDAVDYLHATINILHNDIKENNLVLGKSAIPASGKYVPSGNYQVLLVDFGNTSQGKLYQLTDYEKDEYCRLFPHIAPEVVEGERRQSTHSDMYAVGAIIYRICESDCKSLNASRKKLLNLAEMCRSVQYHKRSSAHKALMLLQEIVD